MKRYSAIVSLLMMVGALAASCSTQEIEIPSEIEESVYGPKHFSTRLAEKRTVTKAVDADGKTTWEPGEKVAVYYEKADDTYGTAEAEVKAVNNGEASIEAELQSPKDGGTVKFVYPASIANTTGDDYDASMLAAQHGTIGDISANFDVATGNSTLKVTSGATCETEGKVTMTNQLLIGKFTPTYENAALDGITRLLVYDGTNIYTITPESPASSFGTGGIYVAMLPVGDKKVTILVATSDANYYFYKEVSLSAGKLYSNLTIPMMGKGADLSLIKTDYFATDGETVWGGEYAYTLSITAGATVTLNGVSINTAGDANAIKCLGSATIVLSGTNTVYNASQDKATINAGPAGTTLTFSGDGVLDAKAKASSMYGAIIGSDKNSSCGNIVINNVGGTIRAQGDNSTVVYGAAIGAGSAAGANTQCGTITLNGGKVVAESTCGAGIGSGASCGTNSASSYAESNCVKIEILGGTVEASSGKNSLGVSSNYDFGGAAIGSGAAVGNSLSFAYGRGKSKCQAISITGGTVNATSNNQGAAIGSGHAGSVSGDIIISGGKTIAKCTFNNNSNTGGAGIGCGKAGTCANITINGGDVEATGSYYATGIGTSYGYSNYPSSCGTITITSGISEVKAINGSGANGAIGRAMNTYSQCTKVYFGDEEMYKNNAWVHGTQSGTTLPVTGTYGGLDFSITNTSSTPVKLWTLTPAGTP